MSEYITTDASDCYHSSEECEAFKAGRRGSDAAGYRLHEIRRVTAEQAEGQRKTACPVCAERAAEGAPP
ncbi:hypothetical protein [Nonomuraea jabiensis]|uniref:Uncharacterized protein n=1 Tax=Nonomuraea jabiensis TaxID=882448 RepID=A0A7W9GFA2_9ACTN|nr:hypothetical protein [Nonomuraea jabiensis]MBB5782626.1 hypothetical protein [Nonomuraea jabiensis]